MWVLLTVQILFVAVFTIWRVNLMSYDNIGFRLRYKMDELADHDEERLLDVSKCLKFRKGKLAPGSEDMIKKLAEARKPVTKLTLTPKNKSDSWK